MKNKGAITVFLLLITTVVFCLMGFLIDGTRILLADYMVDNASLTALRSTMGHYDKTLVSEYGLYAIQDTKNATIEEIYKKYLTANLIGKSTNVSNTEYRPISMVSFDPEDIVECNVSPADPLIRSDVFRHQIEDYMKIRGPVSSLMSILEQLADQLGDKAKDALNNANKAEKENDAGKKAKDSIKNFNSELDDLNKDISKKVTPKKTKNVDWCTEYDTTDANGSNSVYDNVSASIAKELRDVEKTVLKERGKTAGKLIWGTIEKPVDASYSIDKEIEAIKTSLEEAKTSANDYASNMSDSVSTVDSDGTDISKYVDTNYTKPTEIVSNVSSSETEINQVISDLEEKVDAYNEATEQQRVIDALCKLSLYKQENKDDYSDADYINDYNYIVNQSSNSSFKNSLPSSEKLKTLSMTEINNLREDASKKVNSSIDDISEIKVSEIPEVKLPSDNTKADDEKEEGKNNLFEKVEELKTNLTTIQNKERSAGEKRGLFSSIAQYKIADSVYDTMESDAENLGIAELKQTFGFLQSLMDKTALAMYVMDKCTYLTSAAGRDHYFQYGEVEYIIFGNNNQFINLASGVLSVWGFRVLLDSAFYFIKSAILPFSVRAVYALTRGFIEGTLDMVGLIGTDSGCDILPGVDFKIKYDDMCFLMVLFKSYLNFDWVAEPLKDTMQATIKFLDNRLGSKALGSDLTKMYTTVQADVKVKVDLVFLPVLGMGIIDNDYFSEGKFIISKSVISTY